MDKVSSNWCKNNKLAINCDKTKVMLITTYQKEDKLDSTHVSVICDNTELENVNSSKLLDVIIYKPVTWKFHVDKTDISICCNIALLRRIKKCLPHQTQITFNPIYITVILNGVNHPMLTEFIFFRNGTKTHHECSQSYTFCLTFLSMWGNAHPKQCHIMFGLKTSELDAMPGSDFGSF